jgi:lysophospholipase L1-like esterase
LEEERIVLPVLHALTRHHVKNQIKSFKNVESNKNIGGKINMKTILCYGDSNTFGWKPVSFDPLDTLLVFSEYRFDISKRWTGIMAGKLGEQYHIIEEGLPGRTTVWDDPVEGEDKNGEKYLLPCLLSHAPIDLVLLMLGTNDLKMRFSVTAFDIAMSIGKLIGIIKGSSTGAEGRSPEVLLISPPPLGKLSKFGEFLEGGTEKAKKFANYYQRISKQLGCEFLDAGKVIESSPIDGVHFEEKEHTKLGRALADKVKTII